MAKENKNSMDARVDLLLETQINTVEDYIKWVRLWKRVHSDMVSNIMFLKGTSRNIVNEIRDNVNNRIYSFDEPERNQAVLSYNQHFRSIYSKLATSMYDIRAMNKAFLHDGQFGDPNVRIHKDVRHD